MRKVSVWMCWLVLCTISACAQQEDTTVKAKMAAVAFYNLENLFDPADDPHKFDEDFTPDGANHYTAEIYKRKLHNMALVLSRIATGKVPEGPAFVGVAEIENRKVLEDLISQPELQERGWDIVHFESPDTRGIDVALLYQPSLFRVLHAEPLTVDISSEGKKEYTRDILLVKGLLAGDTTFVMVCHWPSRRGGETASKWKRNKAASICRQQADRMMQESPATGVIIMGDLNDDPVSESVARVIGAKGKQKEVPEEGFYNPWVSFYKKGIGTLGYNDSWNLFDQIIISGHYLHSTKGWRFQQAEIFDRSFLKTPFGKYKGYPHRSFAGNTWMDGYSDHFPTCIYLEKVE